MKNWIYVNVTKVNDEPYNSKGKKRPHMLVNADDIHIISDEHYTKGGKSTIGICLPGTKEMILIEVKESVEDILAMLENKKGEA